MGDERPIVYLEGDKVVYRMSAPGSCLKALVAARLGYGTSPNKRATNILSLAAEEGNLHEGAVIDKLQETGFVIPGTQEVVEIEMGNVVLRGHTDGTITGFPNTDNPPFDPPALIEVKSMSKAVYREWTSYPTIEARLTSDRFRRYGYQATCYMKATQMPCVYVAKCRDDGATLIEWLPKPPFSWGHMVARIREVERWAKLGELPECEPTVSKYFCPFTQLHDDLFGDEGDDDFDPITSAPTVALAEMAHRYVELQTELARYKPLDEQRKELGKEIVGLIGVHGPKKTRAGKYHITRVDNSTPYVDWVGLATDMGMTVDDAKAKYTKRRKYSYPKIVELVEGEA